MIKSNRSTNNEINYEVVKNLLNKPNKTKQDLQTISNCIYHLDSFKQNAQLLNIHDVEALIQLKHEFFSSRDIVFKKGSMGQKFYIVLEGSVYVMVSDYQQSMNCENNPMMKSIDPQTFNEIKNSQIPNEQKRLKILYPDMKIAKVLKQGDYFGEISLLTEDVRQATIICSSDCHFMVADKNNFLRIFGKYFKFQIQQQIQFFQQIPCFMQMKRLDLLKLINQVQLQQFSKNNVIFNEEQKSDKVYFIHSGEVQIYKEIKLAESTIFQSKNLSKKKDIKKVPISLLGAGSYFGAEDILNQREYRDSTAICNSAYLELYYLSKDQYLNFIMLNEQSFQQEESMVQTRSNFEDQRLDDLSVVNSQVISPKHAQFVKKQIFLRKRQSENNLAEIKQYNKEDKVDSDAFTNDKKSKLKFAVEWDKLNQCKEKVLNKLLVENVQSKDAVLPGKNPLDIFVNDEPIEKYKSNPKKYTVFNSIQKHNICNTHKINPNPIDKFQKTTNILRTQPRTSQNTPSRQTTIRQNKLLQTPQSQKVSPRQKSTADPKREDSLANIPNPSTLYLKNSQKMINKNQECSTSCIDDDDYHKSHHFLSSNSLIPQEKSEQQQQLTTVAQTDYFVKNLYNPTQPNKLDKIIQDMRSQNKSKISTNSQQLNLKIRKFNKIHNFMAKEIRQNQQQKQIQGQTRVKRINMIKSQIIVNTGLMNSHIKLRNSQLGYCRINEEENELIIPKNERSKSSDKTVKSEGTIHNERSLSVQKLE